MKKVRITNEHGTKTFDSETQVADYLNVRRQSITSALRRNHKCKGYDISIEGYDISVENPMKKRKVGKVRLDYDNAVNEFLNGFKQSRMNEEDEIKDLEKRLAILKNRTIEDNPLKNKIVPYSGGNSENKLIIGDLHEPFTKEQYLEFCRTVQENFDCGTVVFIGDIIDNHYSSFYESDPDGFSAGDELTAAKLKIKTWHDVFPNAKICVGNHDEMILRKAKNSGISFNWIKDIKEVLETPSWEYGNNFIIDDVLFQHGTGSYADDGAYKHALNKGISVVQGHNHSSAKITHHVDMNKKLFSMAVGCGVNEDTYAMVYSKNNMKRFIVSCGVIYQEIPIIVPMNFNINYAERF